MKSSTSELGLRLVAGRFDSFDGIYTPHLEGVQSYKFVATYSLFGQRKIERKINI